MKTRKVVVAAYGVGNLRSVASALESVGAEVDITDDPNAIIAADRLILPGVGAFASCMAALEDRGVREPVLTYLALERPTLGICVGMQMLFESSSEFGRTEGLSVLGGQVDELPRETLTGGRAHLPSIGWSRLIPPGEAEACAWKGGLMDGLSGQESAYFVHSFAAKPSDPGVRLADTIYDTGPICAAVRKDMIHGVQFHPERSGRWGLRILENFINL